MTISKKILTKYRKEALQCIKSTNAEDESLGCTIINAKLIECSYRILAMTQELIDQHLLKEIDKDG